MLKLIGTKEEPRVCRECGDIHYAKSLCLRHYKQWKNKKTRTLPPKDTWKELYEIELSLRLNLETTRDNLKRHVGQLLKKVAKLEKEVRYLRYSKELEFENSTLGQRLQKIRLNRGLTVEELVEKVNKIFRHKRGKLTTNHYLEWEGDMGRPTLQQIVVFCRVTDTSTRYVERGLIESNKDRMTRRSG